MTLTIRRCWAVLLIGIASLLIPSAAQACGTACNMPAAPDCADCQYTFFTRTRCSRTACHVCIEHDCWVASPTQEGERLATARDDFAGTCAASPELVSPAPKVIRVQVLPARS